MILLKNKPKNNMVLDNLRHNHIDDLPYSFNIANNAVFGQVLQIQAIPKKICPGDCLYCPYGRTTHKIIDRECFYSIKKTIIRIEDLLNQNNQIRYIVISGPGEPSLNSDLNWLIDNLKKITSIPIAIDSCGSLLWRISVHKDLLKANVVFVNIDAADKSLYHCINRFHQLIPFDRYIAGIMDFRSAFSGDLYVRVCLLDGLNTHETHFYRLAALVKQLDPKAVFVSTSSIAIDKSRTLAISDDQLQTLAKYFGPTAQVLDADSIYTKHSQTINTISNRND